MVRRYILSFASVHYISDFRPRLHPRYLFLSKFIDHVCAHPSRTLHQLFVQTWIPVYYSLRFHNAVLPLPAVMGTGPSSTSKSLMLTMDYRTPNVRTQRMALTGSIELALHAVPVASTQSCPSCDAIGITGGVEAVRKRDPDEIANQVAVVEVVPDEDFGLKTAWL